MQALCTGSAVTDPWEQHLMRRSTLALTKSVRASPLRMSHYSYLLCQPHHYVAVRVSDPGTLPVSWGALRSLQLCDLGSNKLTGPLPSSWSGMAALKTIDLSWSPLTGASCTCDL